MYSQINSHPCRLLTDLNDNFTRSTRSRFEGVEKLGSGALGFPASPFPLGYKRLLWAHP